MTSDDEAAVHDSVKQMETGWNAKDGALFARPFADDADYVAINGLYMRGRAAIEATHRRIFETVHKHTSIELSVKETRLLRPDTALVHLLGTGKALQDGHVREYQSVMSLVLTRDGQHWKIDAFHNTRVDVA